MNKQKRRRATRLEVKLSHQAKDAVKATALKIAAWQSRLVYLNAIVAHRRANGETVSALLAEAETIRVEIEAHERQLQRRSAELPASITSHSRFQDCIRALGSASKTANSLLS